MDFVDQHQGEYLSVEQLASAAGVAERTLRDAFQQYFGMAPVRYLNRRTLHQVRRALKAADPIVATVTQIARSSAFGSWVVSHGITASSLVNSPPRPCATSFQTNSMRIRRCAAAWLKYFFILAEIA